MEQQKDRLLVQLADGEQLACRLLLATDGGDAAWRAPLGLGGRCETFGQSALITNLRTNGTQSGRAWERFTDGGPLALLPLGLNRLSLVWSMSDAEAASAST